MHITKILKVKTISKGDESKVKELFTRNKVHFRRVLDQDILEVFLKDFILSLYIIKKDFILFIEAFYC